jgi:DNA repair protein RadC
LLILFYSKIIVVKKEKKIESMAITSWALDDRPREKLMLKGEAEISDAELVSILIGSGSKSESALNLSKRILASVKNNLNRLGKLKVSDLTKFKGVGKVKAVTLIAALELGRRRRLEKALEISKIRASKDVFEFMQPLIGELLYEEFWIIYLNNSNKILQKWKLSIGGMTGTAVDLRLVYKRAVELSATAIILCHNHPSGKIQPSLADKQLTSKFKKAGEILDVKLLDHLIVTENAYFSFADEGLLS